MTSWIRVNDKIVVAIDNVSHFPDSIEVSDIPETGINEYLEYDDGVFTVKQLPEPTPPPEPEPTPEQIKITQLEQQLAQTNQDLAAVLEMILSI